MLLCSATSTALADTFQTRFDLVNASLGTQTFPATPVGQTSTVTVTLTNDAPDLLDNCGIQSIPSSFTVDENTCGTVSPESLIDLLPNEGNSCSFDVTFTPASPGAIDPTFFYGCNPTSYNELSQPITFSIVMAAEGIAPPSPPLNVEAEAGNASANVSWDEPMSDGGSEILHYNVEQTIAGEGDWAAADGSCAGNVEALTCSATGLANGTSYEFRVRAVNAVDAGDYSPASEPVTPATVPSAPSAPIVDSIGNAVIGLTWTAPNNGGSAILHYNVEQTIAGENTWVAAGGSCAGNVMDLFCDATGLTNGTSYEFRVRAVNAVDPGPFSDASAPATPAGPPSAPTLDSLTAGNNAFTITWSYGAANGATVTGVTVTAAPGGLTCSDAGTSCTISGLSNGVNYTFTAVTNSSDQGDSGSSNSLQDVAAFTAPPTFEQAGLLLDASQPSRLLPRACGPDEATKNFIPVVVRLANAGNYFFETRVGNFDTLLLLRDASDNRVGCDDDGGAGTLSRIVYNNPTPGALYTVELTNFGSTPRTGTATLCFGEVGSEGGCGFVAPSDTQSVINGTSTGIEARTNEAFTVNYSLFSNVVNTKLSGAMRISARNAANAEVGFCIGDIGDVEVITGGVKPDESKAQPKGTPFNDEATGSCVLSGLKPSANVASLVAVFNAQPGYNPSESSPFGFTVTRSNTSSTLSSNSPSRFGQDIVLSATFNATAPGANPVTGTARFVRQPGNVTIVEVPIVPGIEGAPSTATTTITTNPDVSLSPITYNVVILDNTDFIGSNNNTVHTVLRAETALTINSITPAVGPDIEVNETVTVTATVAAILPGEGTPNGTVQVRGTGGDEAATTGCDISLSGGTGSCELSFSTKGAATLVFSYVESANFAASSASQAVTVLGLPVTMTLTPPPAAPFFGNSYDVGYSLTGGAGDFEGEVSLTSTGPTSATATCVSDSAPANNTGVCTFAGGQAVGAYTLDGAYAGDSQDLPATATANRSIQQATTALSVATSPNSSAAGEPVSIDVQLLLTNGTGALDGTIVITADGLTDEGDPIAGCNIPVVAQASPFTASCERAFTLFGDNQTVTAVFTPSDEDNFAGDTATTEHDVTSALTQTTIIDFDPAIPQVGDAVTVNFEVSGGEGTFEGAIEVRVNGVLATCEPIVNFNTTTGVGSCLVQELFQSPGDYSFVVDFVGTPLGNDASSTSAAEAVTVEQRNTQLALTAAPADEQQAGVDVVFTLNTSAITDGFFDAFAEDNVASGTAYVCLSSASVCDPDLAPGSVICTATLMGAGTTGAATGTCPASFATVGNYSFTARYVGNTNFAGSNSIALPYEVLPRETSISITGVSSFTSAGAPATTALVGEQVTVSFDVNGGLGEYEGSVTISADGPGALSASCESPNFNVETGVGSCTFRVGDANGLEQVGIWSFSADFIPDLEGNDAGSSTGLAAASIEILQASTTLVLSSDPSPSVFGQPFTLTATVTATPPSEGYPTGDVNFFDGESNAIGVVTLTADPENPGISTASIANLTRDVALPNGWRFVAATITNPNFAGANDFGYDHLVNRDNQTVAVTAPTDVDFVPTPPGASFNVSAVATAVFTEAPSFQGVVISAGPAGICSGGGTSTGAPIGTDVVININGAGTCVITASVPQSNNYNAVAPQTTEVEINKIDQEISFAPLPNRPATAGTFDVAATSDSDLTVSFAAAPAEVCTIDGVTVTYVAAGECTITASQAGDDNYNPADPVAQSFFYVAIAISPETLPDGERNAAYGPEALTASGLGSVGPFTWTISAGSLPPGLSLDEITGVISGTPNTAGEFTFSVAAADSSQAPNVDAPYIGERAYTVDIAKNAQTITFGELPDRLLSGGDFTVSATASSGLPVSFSSDTDLVCDVSQDAAGFTVVVPEGTDLLVTQGGPFWTIDASLLNPGVPAATADEARDDFLQAVADWLNVETPATATYDALAGELTVTNNDSSSFYLDLGDIGLFPVTLNPTQSAILNRASLTQAVVGGNGDWNVELLTVGTCSIRASQDGNVNFEPADDVVQSFQVRADVVITTDSPLPNGVHLSPYAALQFAATGGNDSYAFSVTGGALPDGMSLSLAGELSGTPSGAGTYNFEITATDSSPVLGPFSGSKDFVLVIDRAALDLGFVAPTPASVTYSVSGSFDVAVAGNNLTDLVFSAGPAGVCEVDGVINSQINLIGVGTGTCTVTATVQDDANFEGGFISTNVTVDPATPNVGLVIDPTASTSPNDPVTLTATVTGTGAPTGTVSFRRNGVDIVGCVDVALVAGEAECTTTTLPQGTNLLTARYNGDANNNAVVSNEVSQVVRTGTSIALNAGNLTEARFGQAVTVGFTVSGGVATYEGVVTVTATPPAPGVAVSCTGFAGAGGVGSCVLPALVTTGPVLADGYVITAEYAGDNDDGASNTAVSQTLNVLRSNTNTALTIAPVTSSPFGQAFTLTATVTAVAPGGGVPPGTIVFLRDGESIGEVPLVGGVATFNVAGGLPVGNYVFRAEYAQTTNYLQSFENRNYAVTAKATTTTITGASANPSALSAEVVFSYTVTTSPADTTPTGNVTLTASTGETCTATVAAGSCPITFATAGVRTLTAAYVGDSQHAPSTSAAFSQTVNQGSTEAVLDISPVSPAQIGQPVSFDVTVTGTPGSPLPTGTVSVVHGMGTEICSFALPAAGCQVTFSTEQNFSDVRAVYAGDANFTGATSNIVASYVVEKVPTSIVFVTADSTITFGDSIAIATTVSGGINGNLGLVTVTATAIDKAPVSCSAAASAGTCTLVGLEAATWSVSASYEGDADDQASSTAEPITVTVNKAEQVGFVVTATPDEIAFGEFSTIATAGGNGDGAVTLAVTDGAANCSLVDDQLEGTAVGTCTVTATKAESDNYLEASATVDVTVVRAEQAPLIVTADPDTIVYLDTSLLAAEGGSGTGTEITFAVTGGSGACTIDGNVLTGTGVGTCVVTATKTGDVNYLPQTGTVTVTVEQAEQAPLIVTADPDTIVYLGTSLLAAEGGSGTGTEITFAVTGGSGACTIDGNVLTGTGVGTCVVTATKAGDVNYLPQTGTVTVTVEQAEQAPLVVTATPNPVVALQTSTLSTTGGSGDGAVTYAVTEGGTFCSVTGNTLSALAEGTCTVTATKAADDNYLVQTGTVVVTVLPATVDLSIVKTGRYTIGGIVWELLVSNAGPGIATGATVMDVLPAEVVNATATWSCATNSGGGTCVTASGTGDVDVDVNLPANSSVVITITATLIGTPASVSNTAEVIAPDGITDTDPSNNTSTLDLPVALFSNGFEGDPLLVGELKSLGGTVALDGALLETLLEGHKAINAARYWAGEQQLQLQVREVRGLVEVRLLQASAKQGLTSTRWIELWPGDVVRIDYAKSGGDLDSQLAVGPGH